MKNILIIGCFILPLVVLGQRTFLGCILEKPFVRFPIESQDKHSHYYKQLLQQRSAKDLIYLKVDFIFREYPDSRGTVNPTGDDNLNLVNAYNYVHKLIAYANQRFAHNYKLNIPPNNDIPVEPIPIRLLINKIVYTNNPRSFKYTGDSTFVCEFYDEFGGSGISNLGRNIWVNINRENNYYTIDNQVDLHHHLWARAQVVNHELSHGLSLSHTMLTGQGKPYATSRQSGPTEVDDGCDDTPLPSFMIDTLGLPPLNASYAISGYSDEEEGGHPNCAWNQGDKLGCTNNLMDYTGGHALSPCQIGRMVDRVNSRYNDTRLCTNVSADKTIDALGYPQVSYYGKQLTIDEGDKGVPTAGLEQRQDLYFSESVEINALECVDGTQDNSQFEKDYGVFEIKYMPSCR